tara:strand:- start:284 stop:640 length:357 start_codon:yes stop_codon:yes gene_type:complete
VVRIKIGELVPPWKGRVLFAANPRYVDPLLLLLNTKTQTVGILFEEDFYLQKNVTTAKLPLQAAPKKLGRTSTDAQAGHLSRCKPDDRHAIPLRDVKSLADKINIHYNVNRIINIFLD